MLAGADAGDLADGRRGVAGGALRHGDVAAASAMQEYCAELVTGLLQTEADARAVMAAAARSDVEEIDRQVAVRLERQKNGSPPSTRPPCGSSSTRLCCAGSVLLSGPPGPRPPGRRGGVESAGPGGNSAQGQGRRGM